MFKKGDIVESTYVEDNSFMHVEVTADSNNKIFAGIVIASSEKETVGLTLPDFYVKSFKLKTPVEDSYNKLIELLDNKINKLTHT